MQVGDQAQRTLDVTRLTPVTLTNLYATDTGWLGPEGTLDLPAPDAFWRMDGAEGTDETDTVSGLVLSCAGPVGSTAGLLGGARSFDETQGTYLLTPGQPPALAFTADFTFALWFKLPAAPPDATVRYFLAKGSSPHEVTLQVNTNTGNLVFGMEMYLASAPNGSVYMLAPLSVGTWHLLVAWRDTDSQELGLQLDDGPPQTYPYTSAPSAGDDFVLGSYFDGARSFFTGTMDAVGKWNVALTADQRAALWNAGAGREFVAGRWQPGGDRSPNIPVLAYPPAGTPAIAFQLQANYVPVGVGWHTFHWHYTVVEESTDYDVPIPYLVTLTDVAGNLRAALGAVGTQLTDAQIDAAFMRLVLEWQMLLPCFTFGAATDPRVQAAIETGLTYLLAAQLYAFLPKGKATTALVGYQQGQTQFRYANPPVANPASVRTPEEIWLEQGWQFLCSDPCFASWYDTRVAGWYTLLPERDSPIPAGFARTQYRDHWGGFWDEFERLDWWPWPQIPVWPKGNGGT
jgi:hypothetical protein